MVGWGATLRWPWTEPPEFCADEAASDNDAYGPGARLWVGQGPFDRQWPSHSVRGKIAKAPQ